MLTGGYELVHQAMGAEAKAAVWEAERLARRHGHTHVTPLHLASAILCSSPAARALLLSSSTSTHRQDLLPRCFDAALSHLPMACPPPPPPATSHSHMLAPPLPMSNALVTAMKRAHKRCTGGCRRGRRQQLLADVKIQLEHLVVSILDDPSVHRAMKQPSNKGSRVNLNPNVVDKGSSPEQSNQPRPAATVVVCDFGNQHEPLAANLSCQSSGDHPSHAKTGEMMVPFAPQSAAMAILPSWLRPTKTQHLHATAPLFSGYTYHPSQAKTGEVLVPFGAQSAAKTSLPRWLCQHQDAILKCHNTTLEVTCHQRKFIDLSANNFKIMCDELELRVPWHKHIVPHIVSTVLLCRSGMMRRASNLVSSMTWLFFQGYDDNGKRGMASELSNLIFGSHSMFSMVNFGDNSATGNLAKKRKRSREGLNTYVMRRLMEGIQANPHRVMFINGINQLDYESEMAIENLIATGRIMGCNGNEMISLEDVIIVLSTEENSSSRTMVSSTLLNGESVNTQKQKEKGVESRHFSFDLNTSIEDVGEVENFVGDNVGIKSVVDGVFHFH